ncbi:hypothetical protein HMPREF9964_0009 [Streptococcus dysgalactiae subsp. equisimilis SK1249]|nr:hypothetical protein HMPREF9964_0009 [Streptococcus dysgalactiae subsp. equisimilis SK1249]
MLVVVPIRELRLVATINKVNVSILSKVTIIGFGVRKVSPGAINLLR